MARATVLDVVRLVVIAAALEVMLIVWEMWGGVMWGGSDGYGVGWGGGWKGMSYVRTSRDYV